MADIDWLEIEDDEMEVSRAEENALRNAFENDRISYDRVSWGDRSGRL